MKTNRVGARRVVRAVIGGALFAGLAVPTAQAQTDWPVKPVRWILSQSAGAGPDIVARFVAERISKSWNQPIVIDNRPGGQNVIGAQAAARAAPDGYTFYYATTAALITNSFTFKSLPYDPEKDFAVIGIIGKSPFMVAANNALPVKSLAELIALAKREPDKLAFASEGPKTFSGMLGDSFAALAGVKMLHVPYQRSGDAIQDTLGGRTQLVFLPTAALTSHVKSGALRALAVTHSQRLPNLGDVPVMADTFPGFEYSGWHALVAPNGVPAETVARMNRDLDRVLKEPDVVERLASLGLTTEGAGTTAQVAAFMRAERERWARIVKAIGIVPE